MSLYVIEIETTQCDQCHRNQKQDHIEFADSHYYGHKDTVDLCKDCASEGYYICSKCGDIHAKGAVCYKFPEDQ